MLLIRDVVSWNSMISGFVQCGDASTAVKLFKEMQQEGYFPDIFSFSCAFRACGSMETLDLGMSMHKQLVEVGLNIDEIVGGTLVDMYAKCGSLQEARHIFDGLRHRNSIVWGTMLSGYAIHGQYLVGIKLFNQMEDEGIFPDSATFPFILQCCVGIRDLSQGRVVHNIVLKRQWEVENTITNALIDMYAKCGSLEEAHKVFDHMLNQDMISWNTLIAGYVQHEDGFKALDLYERMSEKRFVSDKVTFLAGLKACVDTGALLLGKILHDEVYRCGFESDVVLSSTLVNMYAKWGNLGDACSVFNTLSQYDVVSCGSMITGYIQHEQWLSACKIYELMHQKNIKPDNISFACILKACSGLESVHVGEHIHDDVVRSGLDKDMLIGNALIDMYAKWGRLQDARYSFDKLLSRNLASWNAMMTGYAQFDDSSQTLLLFQRLQYEGMHPDQVSFVCALKACSNAGSIEHGRQIHDQVIRHSSECDLVISNSIIDMYAKCGNLEEANKIFDGLRHRDVVSWSALISGYAQDGSFEKVEHFLMKMKKTGLEPVSKTFTSVLGACSHTGKVKASHMYFKAMREEFKIIPSIEHYNCMIDVLGRAGHFDDACKFLQSFPMFPNVKTWMSLLTSSRTFGRISFGKHCFNELMKQDPNNASAFLIMSKIYADANMWDEVYKLEEVRREKGAWKKPGKACLEIAAEVHEFITKDKGYHHPEVVCLG